MIHVDVEKKLKSRGRGFTLKAAFSSDSQFVILFGPSGSGKTMTLQCIAGLITPDSGKIVFKGRVVYDSMSRTNIPSRQRGIGYVFQDYALFPHLTVLENVGFGLKKTWHWRLCRQARRDVERFLEIFELSHLANSLPLDLSGGQKQRVAMARALMTKPDLLLLDEPFAALDTLLRVKLRKELLEMQSRVNIPLIMITHDPEDIEAFAEALATFDAGRVTKVEQIKLKIMGI